MPHTPGVRVAMVESSEMNQAGGRPSGRWSWDMKPEPCEGDPAAVSSRLTPREKSCQSSFSANCSMSPIFQVEDAGDASTGAQAGRSGAFLEGNDAEVGFT